MTKVKGKERENQAEVLNFKHRNMRTSKLYSPI